MSPKRLAVALFLALVPVGSLAPGAEEGSKPVPPMPSPELTPEQVIEIQVEALQAVDKPTKDAGIATTFRFASPGNRKLTGPLERFTLIVNGPSFRPLVNHRVAGYGRLVVVEDHAIRRITVVAADGQAFEYEFRLTRDPESRCWFTDGVIPIPAKPAIDQGKVARNAQSSSNSRSE